MPDYFTIKYRAEIRGSTQILPIYPFLTVNNAIFGIIESGSPNAFLSIYALVILVVKVDRVGFLSAKHTSWDLF